MSKIKKIFTDTWKILKVSVRNLGQDEPLVYSAAIAFFAIFSLPAILLVVSLVGSLFFAEEDVRSEIISQVSEWVPDDASRQVASVLDNVTDIPSGTWGIIVSIVVILKSATIIIFIVQKALNSVWKLKLKPDAPYFTVAKHRLLTFLLVAGLGLALVLNLMLDTVLSLYSNQLEDLLAEYFPPTAQAIQYLFSLFLTLVIFATIQKTLPDARIAWKDAIAGGIITAVLFIIGKSVVDVIFSNIEIAGIYSAAGSLVIVLLWIFYSAQILFLGAELTKAYSMHHNRGVKPSSIAVKYKKQILHEEEG